MRENCGNCHFGIWIKGRGLICVNHNSRYALSGVIVDGWLAEPCDSFELDKFEHWGEI